MGYFLDEFTYSFNQYLMGTVGHSLTSIQLADISIQHGDI